MLAQTVMTLPQRATAVAGAAAVATAAVVLPPVAAPHLVPMVTVVADAPVSLAAAESAALPDGFDFTTIDPSLLAAAESAALPDGFDFTTIDPSLLAAPAYDDAIAGIPDVSTIVDELTQQAADPAAYVSVVFNPIQFVFGMLHYLWWPVQEIERLISGLWGVL